MLGFAKASHKTKYLVSALLVLQTIAQKANWDYLTRHILNVLPPNRGTIKNIYLGLPAHHSSGNTMPYSRGKGFPEYKRHSVARSWHDPAMPPPPTTKGKQYCNESALRDSMFWRMPVVASALQDNCEQRCVRSLVEWQGPMPDING